MVQSVRISIDRKVVNTDDARAMCVDGSFLQKLSFRSSNDKARRGIASLCRVNFEALGRGTSKY